jgi:hypothetical protein
MLFVGKTNGSLSSHKPPVHYVDEEENAFKVTTATFSVVGAHFAMKCFVG